MSPNKLFLLVTVFLYSYQIAPANNSYLPILYAWPVIAYCNLSCRTIRSKIFDKSTINVLIFYATLLVLVIPSIFTENLNLSNISPVIKILTSFFFYSSTLPALKKLYLRQDTAIHLSLILLIGQAIIIVANFISPTLRGLTHYYFYSSDFIERIQFNYVGQRGFSLAGSYAFGLSSAITLLLVILYLRNILGRKSVETINVMLVIIPIALSIIFASTGRLVFLSLLFFLISASISLMNKIFLTQKFKFSLRNFSYFFFSSMAIILLAIQLSNIEIVVRYTDFALSFFNSDSDISSWSGLLKSIQDAVDSGKIDLYLGSYNFFTTSGTYLGGSDSGYIRNAIFFGLIPSILITAWYIKVMFSFLSYRSSLKKLEAILIIILSLIVHFKGIVLPTAVIYHSFILMIGFAAKLDYFYSSSKGYPQS